MKRDGICYLYSRSSEEFVAQFRELDIAKGIVFVPFANNEVFPAIDLERTTHLIVTGMVDEIKTVLEFARGQQLSVGIVPLPEQESISQIFYIPKSALDAFELAREIPEKKIDLFYCEEILVLSDVRIGNTAALEKYEFQFLKYGVVKRFSLLWQSIRSHDRLRHYKFNLKTEKEEAVTLSAVGFIGLGYNNFSWIAKRMARHLSSIDGQHMLLILSPLSLFQYFVASPVILLFQKWRGDRLPPSCGYIKSSRIEIGSSQPLKVAVDGREVRQTPVVLRTESEALALCVGDTFWEEQRAGRIERSSIRIDNIPKDDETIDYLSKGLPLFKHASKEQYASLFSGLREEGSISSTFIVLLMIAAVIAVLGLFVNSSSVIIGAMILAPLMQPIVSLSMGVLRRDEGLTKNSIKTIAVGIVLVLVVAMLFASMVPIREVTAEMSARLSPTILDLLIAIASGVAAAYVKNDEKISASLAGVAIAVALVPPLAVSGIGLGWGEWHMFFNAFMLFMTNLIGIVFAAASIFLVLGYAPIHVAKRGIFVWAVVAFLIAIPLYHSFETMKEVSNTRSALLHVHFDIHGKNIYLNRVEYRPKEREVEIRCEVITDAKLGKAERDYLKSLIAKVVGKPTNVIATFRYQL